MSESPDERQAALKKMLKNLWLFYTILGGPGIASLFWCVYSDRLHWPGLVAVTGFGFLCGSILGWSGGWLIYHLGQEIQLPSRSQARIGFITVILVAAFSTWCDRTDIPTNAQIEAVHRDPRFAATVEYLKNSHESPDLFLAEMRNGPSRVAHPVLLLIDFVGRFIGLLVFLTMVYGVYRTVAFVARKSGMKYLN